MTDYVVICQTRAEGGAIAWFQTLPPESGETFPARTATEAIKAAIAHVAPEHQNGTYVAIPARSWKPVSVKTETRTVLTLEQPS